MSTVKAIIRLAGLPAIDKTKTVECVVNITEKELIDKLKNLQDGYCEDEKPRVRKLNNNSGNMVIDCYSSADFHYFAILI